MPTQTPALRKFAPPSSNSSSANTSLSSSRAPFITRILRTPQALSSPSTRKNLSKEINDEDLDNIDGDGQDEDDLLPRHTGTASSGYRTNTDTLDVNHSQVKETHLSRSQIPSKQRQDRLHATQASSHATPSSKRRKISHFISEAIDDYGSEPSSPPLPPSPSARNPEHDARVEVDVEVPHSSPDATPCPHDSIETTDQAEFSDPADHSPIAQDIATPKKTSRYSNPISRFKTPFPIPSSSAAATITAPSTQHDATTSGVHQQIPSFQSRLLASSSSSVVGSAGLHLRGPQPSLDYTLPDAFSPSRRRGNREYVHGGYAETVRGWVLDLAARTNTRVDNAFGNDVLGLGQASQSAIAVDRKIVVRDVLLRDPAGRFMIVKTDCEDEGGGQEAEVEKAAFWMLTNVDQHHSQGFGMVSKFDRVKPGVVIVVKGGEAATWTHELQNLPIDSSEVRVAVLWDIAR